MISKSHVRALLVLLASTAGVQVGAQEAAPPVATGPAIAVPPVPPAPAVGPVAQPAQQPDLSPEATAFRDALRAGTAGLAEPERAAISDFYGGRDFAPFWTEPGSDRLDALRAAAEASPEHGLPRYDLAAAPVPGDAAGAEIEATRLYLTLGSALASGILTPSAVDPEIEVRPERPTPAALLARLDGTPVAEALQGLEPQAPDYRRLIAEKARLETLIASTSWGPGVEDGPTLHPGESGPRIAALRARLARLGYGAPSGEAVSDAFDPALTAAVQGFQRDYGLTDDGVVGRKTLEAVNAPAETRLAQVLVNLERARWLNGEPVARYLEVNIPDYTVKLVENGGVAWESRVVVGALKTKTPEFSGVISYMVANPTWHIPDSIAIRDYLPKLQKDPLVLQRQNIRLLTRGGTEINPRLVDFTQYTPENFPFLIKQRPNDDNALGRVKFMFPNQHSIYMHDTPHRELFARDERAFSNGCIRVEKPIELAEILLAGQEADPAAAFDGWLAAKTERNITLERQIPVQITYRSVIFDADGVARYRADIYGRDAAVFDALDAAGVTMAAAQG